LFGLTTLEVDELRPHYNPNQIIDNDPALSKVMQLLESSYFNQFEPGLFDPIIESIRSPYDPWMTAADFHSYVTAQHEAAKAYQDQERWVCMSIINTARSGRFSTDRTMQEYNRDIWQLEPIPIAQPSLG
jgi:starch phosphorylase